MKPTRSVVDTTNELVASLSSDLRGIGLAGYAKRLEAVASKNETSNTEQEASFVLSGDYSEKQLKQLKRIAKSCIAEKKSVTASRRLLASIELLCLDGK